MMMEDGGEGKIEDRKRDSREDRQKDRNVKEGNKTNICETKRKLSSTKQKARRLVAPSSRPIQRFQ